MIFSRPVVLTLAAAALAVIVLANAHLVYVASTSQPDCVPHVKAGGAAPGAGAFGAAKPSC
nr:hypothetical protein [Hephaestia sp. MAHUQ-44]